MELVMKQTPLDLGTLEFVTGIWVSNPSEELLQYQSNFWILFSKHSISLQKFFSFLCVVFYFRNTQFNIYFRYKFCEVYRGKNGCSLADYATENWTLQTLCVRGLAFFLECSKPLPSPPPFEWFSLLFSVPRKNKILWFIIHFYFLPT